MLNNSSLQKFDASIIDVKKKFQKAGNFLSVAKKNISLNLDASVIYTTVYDSIRIACEGMIMLRGFRVKKEKGYHSKVLEIAKKFIEPDLEKEFQRIEKMRRKRNLIEYDLQFISKAELEQAVQDAELLFKKVESLITEKDSQNKLELN